MNQIIFICLARIFYTGEKCAGFLSGGSARSGLVLFSLAVCAALLQSRGEGSEPRTATPPRFRAYDPHGAPLPVTIPWGKYVVRLEGPEEGRPTRLIVFHQGAQILEITAPFIDLVDFPELTGHPPRELAVHLAPMQNTLDDIRQLFFTQEGGFHNILTVEGGVYDGYEFDWTQSDAIHAPHPGARAILVTNSAAPFEWDVGCHACSPSITLVIGARHGRYELENQRFPRFGRTTALRYRKAILHPDSEWLDDMRLGNILGYYANMELNGHKVRALRWLRAHVTSEDFDAFQENLPHFEEVIAWLPTMLTTVDKRSFDLFDLLDPPGESPDLYRMLKTSKLLPRSMPSVIFSPRGKPSKTIGEQSRSVGCAGC